MLTICDLNLDCLVRIFCYCSPSDLVNLCRASSFFNSVINNHIYFAKTLDLLLCGHRDDPAICDRTFDELSYRSRLSIGANWLNGRYTETTYFNSNRMCAAKIHLDKDNLYITHQRYLRIHKRLRDEPVKRRCTEEICTNSKADISDFSKKNNTIFAGRVYGSGFIYEEGIVTDVRLHDVSEYLWCVDFSNNLFLSSTDKCTKMWQRADQFGLLYLDLAKEYPESYKTMQLNQDGDRFYGGLYTDKENRALREVDIETGTQRILNSKTFSIYDLKLKDDNVFFTANFDTTFRMYDRRVDADVGIWEDQFGSSIYCLEYDGLYAVLCGVKHHCRVNLYDIRMPEKCVQIYFPSARNGRSSPVYSIACDSRYLFVATDRNLRVLDFKADWAANRDYRNLFKTVIRG
ncbi:F-box/WD repeat-containing protein 4 [Episyrphus balteatus]|uniref:F-box/WD repeat-containing protein 4 n=1 Tax=Episyrphus balteatus TaxID=286459 RepID=UPI0024869703|nr:F-box/WD repeat-containing protein 4 [Episyrphus balteatus]